jgi:hypothetical protein
MRKIIILDLYSYLFFWAICFLPSERGKGKGTVISVAPSRQFGWLEVYMHSCLISALDRDAWTTSRCVRFTSRKSLKAEHVETFRGISWF